MSTSIPFDDPRWKATPEPQVPLDITPDKLIMVNNDYSNWWHAPDRDNHNGIVYGFEVDITNGIEISVELDMDAKLLVRPLLLFNCPRADEVSSKLNLVRSQMIT